MTAASPEARDCICVVEDDPDLAQTVEMQLQAFYEVRLFRSAGEFLEWHRHSAEHCSLVVSDIVMPGLSGFDLCREVRAREGAHRLPVILVTGGDATHEKAVGLDAGADDFIQKPIRLNDLLAKIRSLLSIRAQETRKMSQLTRFFSPKVADLVASGAGRTLLKPHRAEVTVLFADLRRFTAFSERAEPEEVLEVLGAYYTAVGQAALRHGGTLGHLAGDGVMVFFNDPQPIERHQEVAVRMALEVRVELEAQRRVWRERRYEIDFGIGIAHGYATIGEIGFERFCHYSVIGPVTNFSARLCQAANDGQILVSERFLARLGVSGCVSESVGQMTLKGIQSPVSVHNIVTLAAAEDSGHSEAA